MEWEFEVSRTVINPITRLLIVAVDVREPANTSADNLLEIFTMPIQEDEILLGKRSQGKRSGEKDLCLTCSFSTSDTAKGLFGWTLGDVTEGQPFWKGRIISI